MYASRLHFSALLALLALASACGRKEQTSCARKDDQFSSYMAPMNIEEPTIVNVDPRFTEDERDRIALAAATWNAYSGPALKKTFFEVRYQKQLAATSPDSKDTQCRFDGSDDTSFWILREESGTKWNALGMTDNNPGVTIRCNIEKVVRRQVVMINPKLINPMQLTSVALHELGHAVGLDHSCVNESGRDGYATCAGLAADHPYRAAVMFPTLRVGAAVTDFPETKEDLRSNDASRATCLYGGG